MGYPLDMNHVTHGKEKGSKDGPDTRSHKNDLKLLVNHKLRVGQHVCHWLTAYAMILAIVLGLMILEINNNDNKQSAHKQI